ncbi:MAG: carboxypeptidase-like regulatory domain-containing protein, partial [Armatimonadota bacterium]|nr:carboxypeptidase-like regulatory domain-containing protein [Armatimonadota bacterium]
SEEAEEAANALYTAARSEGQLVRAREYKRQALAAAERLARERYPGKPLPATHSFIILGYRVDLAGLELQLQHVVAAREFLSVATREAQRLKALPSLERDLREDLQRTETRMDRVRNEVWVAGLFRDLKVGAPGPPPKSREFNVSGRVMLHDRPLPEVEVILLDSSIGGNINPQGLLWVTRSRYRATSDVHGRYRISGVRAGDYSIVAVYALRPRRSGNFAIAPVADAARQPAFPQSIKVSDKSVILPPVRFGKAVATRTFGELPPRGKAVRLEWDAWPGAAAYRVEVLAGPEMAYLFNKRVAREKLYEFQEHPMLWQSGKTTMLHADCPLLSLAPDNPSNTRFTHYTYTVTALDRAGKTLAVSAAPLCRFLLSPEARGALLELNPPVRSRRRFRGQRPRRRLRQGLRRNQP